jgi:RecA-family ATPase
MVEPEFLRYLLQHQEDIDELLGVAAPITFDHPWRDVAAAIKSIRSTGRTASERTMREALSGVPKEILDDVIAQIRNAPPVASPAVAARTIRDAWLERQWPAAIDSLARARTLSEIRDVLDRMQTHYAPTLRGVASESLAAILDAPDASAAPVLGDYLFLGGSAFLHGEDGAGKSFLALQLAGAVASGLRLLRWFDTPGGGVPVMFVQAELSCQVFRDRAKRLASRGGITRAGIDNFEVIHRSMLLAQSAGRGKPVTYPDLAELSLRVRRQGTRLLVLDPFSRYHQVEENSSDEVRQFTERLHEFRNKYQLALLLVHHNAKRTEYNRGHAMRGSTAFRADAELSFEIRSTKKAGLTLVMDKARHAPLMPPLPVTQGSDGFFDAGGV